MAIAIGHGKRRFASDCMPLYGIVCFIYCIRQHLLTNCYPVDQVRVSRLNEGDSYHILVWWRRLSCHGETLRELDMSSNTLISNPKITDSVRSNILISPQMSNPQISNLLNSGQDN